jgi:hypothetical protein
MANKNFSSQEPVVLKGVVLQYPNLYQMSKPAPGTAAKPAYDARFIFEKDSEVDKLVKATMMACAKELWGESAQAVIGTLEAAQIPRRSGDKPRTDLTIDPNTAGKVLLAAKSKTNKPLVIGPKKVNGQAVEISEDGQAYQNNVLIPAPYKITVPYGGCIVNAKVQITATNGMPDKGVPRCLYAQLIAVQFVRDGEAFGGDYKPSAEGFEDEPVEELVAATATAVTSDDVFAD